MSKLIASLAAAALLAGGLAAPAAAQRDSTRDNQASAREEMRAGRNLPLSVIERRIVPQMKDNDYLGVEYVETTSAYRLKFIREGQVTWVDVDARTGKILRVSR